MSAERPLPERVAVAEATIDALRSDTIRVRDGLDRMEISMGTTDRKLDLLIQSVEDLKRAIGAGRKEAEALSQRLTALEHTVGQWRAVAGSAFALAGLGIGREFLRWLGWAP